MEIICVSSDFWLQAPAVKLTLTWWRVSVAGAKRQNGPGCVIKSQMPNVPAENLATAPQVNFCKKHPIIGLKCREYGLEQLPGNQWKLQKLSGLPPPPVLKRNYDIFTLWVFIQLKQTRCTVLVGSCWMDFVPSPQSQTDSLTLFHSFHS